MAGILKLRDGGARTRLEVVIVVVLESSDVGGSGVVVCGVTRFPAVRVESGRKGDKATAALERFEGD